LVREKAGVGMQTFHTVVAGSREILYDTTSGETCVENLPEELKTVLDQWTRGTKAD
jgi:hypothetical protein